MDLPNIVLYFLCAALVAFLIDHFLGAAPVDKRTPSMLYGHLRLRYWRALLTNQRKSWALDRLSRMDRAWLAQTEPDQTRWSNVTVIPERTDTTWRQQPPPHSRGIVPINAARSKAKGA